MIVSKMYVYDLPYGVKENLVALLDFDRTWMRLATTCLGYSHIDVAKFEQARYKNTGDTPAAAMISNYGMKNKTVGELYKALHQLGMTDQNMALKNASTLNSCRPLPSDDGDQGLRVARTAATPPGPTPGCQRS